MSAVHPQSQSVAASYLVGERLIRMFIGFFVHTWMARSYSPEDFGFISFTVKSVGIYFAFSLFGVDEVIIKLLVGARDQEEKRDVLKTALLLRLGIGFVGWVALALITGYISGTDSDVWITSVIFGSTILLQAFTVYELPFYAQMTMRPIFFVKSTSYLAGAFAKFVAFFSNWNRFIFVGLYGVEDVLWKGLLLHKSKQWGFLGGKWNGTIARLLWNSGLLAFLATFISLFDQRLAFLHLESFEDGGYLGAYSVIVSLMDMAVLLPMSLATALYPKVASAQEHHTSTYLAARQKMSNTLVWAGLGFACAVYVCAPYILALLYQGKYDYTQDMLRGMGFVSIWTFFNIARFKWFALEHNLKDWLALSLLSLLLQAFALGYFVPTHGLLGVVMGIATGQLGASLLLSFRPSVRQSWRVFLGAFIPPLGYH